MIDRPTGARAGFGARAQAGGRLCLPALLVAALLLGGCAEVSQVAGDVMASQARESTYQREYKQARARGIPDAEARAGATKAAEAEAARQKSLVTGLSDVVSSTGEIDYQTERTIGESLALEAFNRYGLPVNDDDLQRYVNTVGLALARNSLRPGLPYRFVVVQSPLYNAFAAPGGIIFVSSALARVVNDESELAGVLAHELGHVGHKHALQTIKRAKFFEGVGKISAGAMKGDKGRQFQGMIGDLQTALFDRGLDKNMEFEADLAAMETAYRTGYDPSGIIRTLETLQRNEATARKDGSWFSTHPPLPDRLARTRAQLARYPDARKLATVPDRFAYYRARLR